MKNTDRENMRDKQLQKKHTASFDNFLEWQSLQKLP